MRSRSKAEQDIKVTIKVKINLSKGFSGRQARTKKLGSHQEKRPGFNQKTPLKDIVLFQ